MLSIVMPTYRRPAILAQTLAELGQAMEGLEAELIVVNDDTAPITATLPPGARVVPNRGKGPGAARNTGVALSRGGLLLFVDDDVLLTRAHLDHLLSLVNQHPEATVNPNWHYPPELLSRLAATPFGRYLIAKGRTTMRGWAGGGPDWERPELRLWSGVGSYCLLMTRATYDRVGGYSEHMPISGDDAWLSQRLRELGVPMWVTTHITVGHNEADRADLDDYLDRQERGAVGIGRSVRAGVNRHARQVGALKELFIQVMAPLEPALRGLVRHWPITPALDPLHHRLVNLLYLIVTQRGYRRGLAPDA